LRKYVFIVLSVLLLLTFATLVYAEEPQIKLGGNIMIRGWYFHNATFLSSLPSGVPITGFNPTNAVPGSVESIEYVMSPVGEGPPIPIVHKKEPEDAALWTTDISLTVDAKVSDNVQGFVELEIAEGEALHIPAIGTLSLAGNPQSGSYIWGNYESKPDTDLKLRQAWIQYTGSGLFGVPSGIKIGHQLLTLGEKQFMNHERFGDDALVAFVNPTKELSLALATAKLNEGYYTLPGDDIDVYALIGDYKVNKDNTIGLYYAYFDCDDLTQALGLYGLLAPSYNMYAPLNGLSFQDLGAHAHGLLSGMLSYELELDAQFGKADVQPDDRLVELGYTPADYNDWKYSGYAVYLKGGYKLPDTPLNLRASFAYGSGQNTLDTNKIKEFQVTEGFDSETNIDRFVHYTQIYERTIATAALMQTLGGNGNILATPYSPHRNTGIANTTYYNLGIDLAATKDLSMSLDGYILRASKVGGWEDLIGDSVSKSVGWEADFTGTYKLSKNLNYFVEAGYFSPGSFYTDTHMVVDRNSVTQLIHGLNLTF
jgi:hypothetical protein